MRTPLHSLPSATRWFGLLPLAIAACSVYTPELLEQRGNDDGAVSVGGDDGEDDDATGASSGDPVGTTTGGGTASTGSDSASGSGTGEGSGGAVSTGSGEGTAPGTDATSPPNSGSAGSNTGEPSMPGGGGAVVPPGSGGTGAATDDAATDDGASGDPTIDDGANDDSASDGSASDDGAADDGSSGGSDDAAAADDGAESDDSAIDQDGPSDDPLIDDFENAGPRIRAAGLREGFWFTTGEGGGTITDVDDALEGVPGGGGTAAHVVAADFDAEYPTGAFGVSFNSGDEVPYHQAEQYDGISFWACSPAPGGSSVRFEVKTEDSLVEYNHYRVTVNLTNEWKQFQFEWDRLTQDFGDTTPFDASVVIGIQWNIVSDGDTETLDDYDLWVDDVEFIDGGMTSAMGHTGLCPGAAEPEVDPPAGDAGAP